MRSLRCRPQVQPDHDPFGIGQVADDFLDRFRQAAHEGWNREDLVAAGQLRLPQQIDGLYHAGSVGIIMSGWLGAVNYGVIVANEVDGYLMNRASQTPSPQGMKKIEG